MTVPTFSGFPEATFRFLRDIAGHNDRAWFEAHRADYEAGYVAPARLFVEALGPRLKAISRSVRFEPKVNGSIARINRDIRFARDKRPYKDYLDLWFWHGERRGWEAPGFFFRLTADALLLGVGMHQFMPPALDAFRKAVVDDGAGRALATAIGEVRAAGPYLVGGSTRKSVPRGFDAGHARADLLMHEGLWAELRTKPDGAPTPDFLDFCSGHFAAMWPISHWLLDEVVPAR